MLAALRKSPEEELPPPLPLVSVQPFLMVVSSTPAKVPQNIAAKTQRPQRVTRTVGQQQKLSSFIRKRPSQLINTNQSIAIPQASQVDEVISPPPMEINITADETVEDLGPDPSILRVAHRYSFTQHGTNHVQRLMIYIDGVLCVRDHSSGQYVFREGVQEGLHLLRHKVGSQLRVSLIVAE